jgi:probable HAF family extracellular repeat protein
MLAAVFAVQAAKAQTHYTITDLGTLGTSTGATAINDRGQLTGSSTMANGKGHAFLYSNGRMRDLATLAGRQ